jgi:NAD(P)-dependent dehydrogenase (short-subunit alcohol dehydrogenase family)
MKSFNGKVAAITGAASGIGRALALQLAGEGCNLSLSDVNEADLQRTIEMAQQAADKAGKHILVTGTKLDVSSREGIYAWADKTVADHGKVNLIFNNAGVALGATVEGVDYDDFEWIMNINFWGVVYGTKAFLPHLKASRDGHIINVSSIFGLFSQPTQCTYNASKFAVRGFTESLRQELDMQDCGVSATCVHPGGIKTNIARTARYTDSVSQLTGQSEADGKRTFEKMFITTPERAAKIILGAVRQDKRRILVGPDAVAIDLMVRSLPETYQTIVTKNMQMMTKMTGSKKKAKATAQAV